MRGWVSGCVHRSSWSYVRVTRGRIQQCSGGPELGQELCEAQVPEPDCGQDSGAVFAGLSPKGGGRVIFVTCLPPPVYSFPVLSTFFSFLRLYTHQLNCHLKTKCFFEKVKYNLKENFPLDWWPKSSQADSCLLRELQGAFQLGIGDMLSGYRPWSLNSVLIMK